MTTPNPDPRVNRVLLRYREAVARATERAYREMEALGGVPDEPTAELAPAPSVLTLEESARRAWRLRYWQKLEALRAEPGGPDRVGPVGLR